MGYLSGLLPYLVLHHLPQLTMWERTLTMMHAILDKVSDRFMIIRKNTLIVGFREYNILAGYCLYYWSLAFHEHKTFVTIIRRCSFSIHCQSKPASMLSRYNVIFDTCILRKPRVYLCKKSGKCGAALLVTCPASANYGHDKRQIYKSPMTCRSFSCLRWESSRSGSTVFCDS